MQIRLILIALLVSLVGLWGCSGDSGDGDTTEDDNGVKTTDNGDTTSGEGGTDETTPAVTTSLDLSYISEEFGLAMILRPAKALETDLASQLPIDMLTGDFTRETGIDPHDLEQVVFLMALPEGYEKAFEPREPFRGGPPPLSPEEEFFEETEAEEPIEAFEEETDEDFGDEFDEELEEELDADEEMEEEFDPEFDEDFDEDFDYEPPPQPIYGLIMRFREPLDDKESLLESFFGGEVPETAEHDGVTYYQSEYGPNPFFPDDKTLVAGDAEVVRSMISAKNVDSPLVNQLRKTDVDHDAVLVVVAEPFRDIIDKVLENEEIPPPVKAAMQTVVENTAAVTASVDVAGDTLFSATLHGKDKAAAENLEKFVSTWFDTGKKMFNSQKDEMAAEVPFGLGDVLKNVAEQIVAGISIKQTGTDVAVVLKRPADLDALPKQLEPAIEAALAQAKLAETMSSLHEIGYGLQDHVAEHDMFPPQAICAEDGTPLLSWRVALLPAFYEDELYEQFKLDEPWDSEHNIKLLEEMPYFFESDSDTDEGGKTRYMVFTGEGAPFNGKKGLSPAAIRDGTSRTIAVVQAGPDKAVPWTKPQDLPFDPDDPLQALGEISEAGIPAVFFDSHVEIVPADADKLKAMITPDGGEITNE